MTPLKADLRRFRLSFKAIATSTAEFIIYSKQDCRLIALTCTTGSDITVQSRTHSNITFLLVTIAPMGRLREGLTVLKTGFLKKNFISH